MIAHARLHARDTEADAVRVALEQAQLEAARIAEELAARDERERRAETARIARLQRRQHKQMMLTRAREVQEELDQDLRCVLEEQHVCRAHTDKKKMLLAASRAHCKCCNCGMCVVH